MNKATSIKQIMTVIIDASGPKSPPVNILAPLMVGLSRLPKSLVPETLKPSRGPSVKFHAQ